jgi:hypothetical protein
MAGSAKFKHFTFWWWPQQDILFAISQHWSTVASRPKILQNNKKPAE